MTPMNDCKGVVVSDVMWSVSLSPPHTTVHTRSTTVHKRRYFSDRPPLSPGSKHTASSTAGIAKW